MARRQVLEIKCDRCGRTETQELTPGADGAAKAEMTISFHGEEVVYGDLCLRCRSACENYFKSVTKQTDEKDAASSQPEQKKSGLLGLGGRKTG